MNGLVTATYLCGACLFVVLPFLVFGLRAITRPYGAATLFSWVFALTYFIVPVLADGTGQHWHQDTYGTRSMMISLAWFVLFGVCVFAGFFATARATGSGCTDKSFDPASWSIPSGAAIVTGSILSGAVIFVGVGWFIVQIMTHGLGVFLQNRILLLSGMGYMSAVMLWPLSVAVITQGYAHARRGRGGTRWWFALPGVFTVAAVMTGLMTGSRTTVLMPLVIVALVQVILGSAGKLDGGRILRLAGFAAAILIAGFVMGQLRENIFADESLHDLTGTEVSMSTALVSAYGEYENTWWMAEHPARVDYLNGKTFLAAAVGFVPRRVWPDKPLGGGPYLTNMIYPGEYDLGGGWNLTSYTTGLVAEAFMNGGVFGVIVVGIVFGVVLGAIDAIRRLIRSPIMLGLWVVLLYRGVFALKAEVFGNAATTFAALTPVVVFWACAWLSSRRVHGGAEVPS